MRSFLLGIMLLVSGAAFGQSHKYLPQDVIPNCHVSEGKSLSWDATSMTFSCDSATTSIVIPNCKASDGNTLSWDDTLKVFSCDPAPAGAPHTVTTYIPLDNCVSDQTGNNFYTVASMSNWFSGHWEFTINQNSYINCMVRVPHSLATISNAAVVLEATTSDSNVAHAQTFQVCDSIVGLGGSMDIGTPTCAPTQTFSPTGAWSRSTLSYAVQSTVTADGILIVKIAASTSGSTLTANPFVFPYLKIDQSL